MGSFFCELVSVFCGFEQVELFPVVYVVLDGVAGYVEVLGDFFGGCVLLELVEGVDPVVCGE